MGNYTSVDDLLSRHYISLNLDNVKDVRRV